MLDDRLPTLILMDIEIDKLARRPEGHRILVYLDQSTLSALVTEESHARLLKLLRDAVDADRLICPVSPSHGEESARLHPRKPDTWKAIDKLADELALGTRFLSTDRIELAEINAAAAAFEKAGEGPLWKEAFRADPHLAREKIFFGFGGAQIRVRAYFEPDAADRAEVDHKRSREVDMDGIYTELRDQNFSFEELAEGNLEQMVNWKLGPLLAPREFARRYAERQAEVQEQIAAGEQPDLEPGSSLGRLLALESRRTYVESLVQQHPEIRRRADEFRHSAHLRQLPTLAYPALLRAGLSAHRGRRAKPSDGYDIAHLTVALSRCEIITADGGMSQLIKDHRLAPAGCEVFSYREIDPLIAMIEARLAAGAEAE